MIQTIRLNKIELQNVNNNTITFNKDIKNISRNLLLNSGIYVENTLYNIANYTLSKSIDYIDGDEFTITIWGKLNENKTKWSVYNSNSGVNITPTNTFIYNSIKKCYIGKFKWKSIQGTTIANNTSILVYAYPSSVQGALSSINKIKLEQGWNDDPIWTPAPEDSK